MESFKGIYLDLFEFEIASSNLEMQESEKFERFWECSCLVLERNEKSV